MMIADDLTPTDLCMTVPVKLKSILDLCHLLSLTIAQLTISVWVELKNTV